MPDFVSHDYATARSIANVVVGTGLALIVIGILLLLMLMGAAGGVENLLSGLGVIPAGLCLYISVLGMLVAAAGYGVHAVLVNAETTSRILAVVEESMQTNRSE